MSSEMLISREELKKEKIPLEYRDFCAHLLPELNACRRATLFMPWKCKHERHVYELCQYKEYKKRVAALEKLKAADS